MSNDYQQRPMVKGNWKCSNPECGAEITELPFEPDGPGGRKLFCQDCYKKNNDNRRSDNRF